MPAKIIGTIWLILGLFWMIKPQILKNRLIKKTNRRFRWAVYGLILTLIYFLINLVIKAQGLLLKIIGIAAIFAVVKITLLVTTKATERVFSWAQKQPLLIFRLWGAVIFLVGVFLLVGR